MCKQESRIKFWLDSIYSEYYYWDKSAQNNKKSYKSQTYSIIDYNKNLLESKDEIRVLDVGCGPRGALRDKYNLPENIKVYSCDPLAFLYMNILAKNNIKTQKNIKFCLAELLSFFYPENFFDYIIIQNALDHSINPQMAIEECLKILKKNGTLYLFHEENEALICNYSGFHQWNLSLNEAGDFIISDKTTDININEIYNSSVEIVSERILYENNLYWVKSEVKKVEDFISKTDNNDVAKMYLTSFMSFIQERIIVDSNNSNYQKKSRFSILKNIKRTLSHYYR